MIYSLGDIEKCLLKMTRFRMAGNSIGFFTKAIHEKGYIFKCVGMGVDVLHMDKIGQYNWTYITSKLMNTHLIQIS